MQKSKTVVSSDQFVSGQLMIRFNDDVSTARAEEIVHAEGAEILTRYSDPRMFHIRLPATLDVAGGMQRFETYDETDFVEPNKIFSVEEVKE